MNKQEVRGRWASRHGLHMAFKLQAAAGGGSRRRRRRQWRRQVRCAQGGLHALHCSVGAPYLLLCQPLHARLQPGGRAPGLQRAEGRREVEHRATSATISCIDLAYAKRAAELCSEVQVVAQRAAALTGPCRL